MPNRYTPPMRSGLFGGQAQAPGQVQSEPVRRRIGGLFNPTQDPTHNPANAPPEESGDNDVYAQTLETLSKTGPATEAFGAHVKNIPLRENYGGGWMNRVAAMLTGTSAALSGKDGVGAALRVRSLPYDLAMEKYDNEGKGLEFLAQREENERQNQLGLVKAIRDSQLEERKVRSGEITAGAAQSNSTSNAAYRKAMADDLARKGWEFYDDDKGNRIAFKMGQDGTVQKQDLGPSVKKTELAQTNTRNSIAATQANAATTSAQAATTNAQANMNRSTQSFQPPTQQFYAKALAAKKAVEEHPEWRGFIDKDGNVLNQSPGFAGMFKQDFGQNTGYPVFLKRVKEIEDEINRTNRTSGSPFGNSFDPNATIDMDAPGGF